jgi:hypothetical protein
VLASSRAQFGLCFRNLISSWRDAWMAGSGNGPFSFLFVQLAAWDALQTGRLPGNVTSIRLGQADAQTRARQNPLAPASPSDPAVDTGMVVAIDLGSRGIKTEVHPRNKSEVASLWRRQRGRQLRSDGCAHHDGARWSIRVASAPDSQLHRVLCSGKLPNSKSHDPTGHL